MQRRTLILLLIGAVALLAGLVGCFALFGGGGSQVEHDYVSFDVSPDGKQVVFSSADADLYLLNLQTRWVRRLTNSKAVETAPAFSPDGKFIAYAADDGEGREGTRIWVRSLDGKAVRQVTQSRSASDTMPCFSPDGRRIAFVRAHLHRLYSMGGWTWDKYDVNVMDRNGSNLHCLTQHKYYGASNPCFVNAGKTLVFAASGDYPDTLTYLLTVPANGS